MDYMHYNLVCFFMNPPALHGQKNINADNKDREREREREIKKVKVDRGQSVHHGEKRQVMRQG